MCTHGFAAGLYHQHSQNVAGWFARFVSSRNGRAVRGGCGFDESRLTLRGELTERSTHIIRFHDVLQVGPQFFVPCIFTLSAMSAYGKAEPSLPMRCGRNAQHQKHSFNHLPDIYIPEYLRRWKMSRGFCSHSFVTMSTTFRDGLMQRFAVVLFVCAIRGFLSRSLVGRFSGPRRESSASGLQSLLCQSGSCTRWLKQF